MKILKHKNLIIIIVIFTILYALISFVNHYTFRTKALDLGIYTNAMYNYLHFNLSNTSGFKPTAEPILADHFDLYLILLSPLVLIFKTYALLVAQLVALIFGGIGVYKYVSIFSKHKYLALFSALYFYLFFGTFSSISYDYHSNVIATALVPFLLYYFHLKKIKLATLFFLLIIIAKENMALWLVFIFIGLLIQYRKDKYYTKYLIIYLISSISYFLIITGYVMPSLSSNNNFNQFRYSVLGENYSDALKFFFLHPFDAFVTFFTNHKNAWNGNYVKLETLLYLLLSGIFFLIKKPYYLVMLIPIFFQKFFHDQVIMWSFFGQYCIEFTSIMSIGIFLVINDIKKSKIVHIISFVIILFTTVVTIRVMDNTIYPSQKSLIRFYKPSHYQRDFSLDKVHKAIKSIPPLAPVSAYPVFVPHLALRPHVYQYPLVNNAEYIIFSEHEGFYPFHSREAFNQSKKTYTDSKDWKTYYDDEGILILQKVN